MKHLFLSLWLLFTAVVSAAELEWMTDLPAALKRAQSQDKAVLLNFAGNDEFSKRIKEEVFSQAEFIGFAKANLVLVEADLSGDKSLPAEQVAKNDELATEFEVEGTPIVFILDKNGVKLAKGGYVEGGAKNYISLIERIQGFRSKPYTLPAPDRGFTNLPQKTNAPFIQLAPAVQYTNLFLKGISVGKQKTAMINNKTLAEGETANVKVAGKQVKIQCVQIASNAVIVQVEDESRPRELTFRPQSSVK